MELKYVTGITTPNGNRCHLPDTLRCPRTTRKCSFKDQRSRGRERPSAQLPPHGDLDREVRQLHPKRRQTAASPGVQSTTRAAAKRSLQFRLPVANCAAPDLVHGATQRDVHRHKGPRLPRSFPSIVALRNDAYQQPTLQTAVALSD